MNRMFVVRCILIAVSGVYISLLLRTPLLVSAEHSYTASKAAGDVKMIPFYWIVGIVGGSIAITLTYVGWKKYKAEAKKQTDDDENS
ncbi:hypothetical protein GCM10008983_22170 [Lentibacillus halophilus]|uniref:Sporulation protein YpjB (SpoYpjB) n=1 Tax=Lentibacillus halophilus TaxID=295065 RepID=A0ABN0ZE01_9BACI